ncbi:MAG: hypothetical protein PHQ66_02765 [Candidatus Nanoarchaeia archaeon]|nr:hypothetical protein [Candidatus Nanoarchaeia archaeon]MDD5357711.1 hypothetical protein [Candidatus Nanoarchaeia archaeon]MDD5588630.1 hypothetical protein [Candidatus Nanoarchaeia archaeon]
MAGKNIPIGVKIISILYYIGAGSAALFGLLFLFSGGIIGSLEIPILSELGSGFFAFMGIFVLIVGGLAFLVGRGLWKIKNWAKIVAIIISALGVLAGVSIIASHIANGIIYLAINGATIGYLLFNKEAKRAFSKK